MFTTYEYHLVKNEGRMYRYFRDRYFKRSLDKFLFLLNEGMWTIGTYVIAGFTLGYFACHLIAYYN